MVIFEPPHILAFVTNNISKCGAFQIKNFIHSGDTFVIVFPNVKLACAYQVEADKEYRIDKKDVKDEEDIFILYKKIMITYLTEVLIMAYSINMLFN